MPDPKEPEAPQQPPEAGIPGSQQGATGDSKPEHQISGPDGVTPTPDSQAAGGAAQPKPPAPAPEAPKPEDPKPSAPPEAPVSNPDPEPQPPKKPEPEAPQPVSGPAAGEGESPRRPALPGPPECNPPKKK